MYWIRGKLIHPQPQFAMGYHTVWQYKQANPTAAAITHPNRTTPVSLGLWQNGRLSWPLRALHKSMRRLPKDWRRRPGRPCHTWLVAKNTGSRPSAAQPRTELSVRPRSRTMEAARGNGYAPIRSLPVMMMIILGTNTMLDSNRKAHKIPDG